MLSQCAHVCPLPSSGRPQMVEGWDSLFRWSGGTASETTDPSRGVSVGESLTSTRISKVMSNSSCIKQLTDQEEKQLSEGAV